MEGEIVCLSHGRGRQENQEWIARHSFSVNGDVRLSGRFSTIHALEGRLELGCVERHFIYFRLLACDDHVLIIGAAGKTGSACFSFLLQTRIEFFE